MSQADRGRRYVFSGGRKPFRGAVFIALAICLPLPETNCSAADVAVSIHLDADSVEIIRGMRRANGIDPPDRAADQRVANILTRARDRQREKAVAGRLPARLPPASAPRTQPNFMQTNWGAGDVLPLLAVADAGIGNNVLAYPGSTGRGRCHRTLAYP